MMRTSPAAPRPRPTSARRAASPRRPPQLVIHHGAPHSQEHPVHPLVDTYGGFAGPGHFRNFSPRSKFIAEGGAYAMGDKADFHSGSEFQTMDVSKQNEGKHQWQKIDTFQTPYGHVKDTEDDGPKSNPRPAMLHSLRVKLLADFKAEMSQLREDVRKDNRKDVRMILEEILQAREAQPPGILEQILAEVQKGGQHTVNAVASVDFSALEQAIANINVKPVVNVDLTRVEQAIAEQTVNAVVDFSGVERALANIHLKPVDVDLTRVEQVIADMKQQVNVDFTRVERAIAAFDEKLVVQRASLENAIAGINLTPVVDVDLSRLERAMADINLNPVVNVDLAKHVDLTRLEKAIADISLKPALNVDLTRVERAIEDIDQKLFFQMRGHLQNAIAGIDLKSIVNVDITRLESAIAGIDVKPVVNVTPQVDIDVSALLQETEAIGKQFTMCWNKLTDIDKNNEHFLIELQKVRDAMDAWRACDLRDAGTHGRMAGLESKGMLKVNVRGSSVAASLPPGDHLVAEKVAYKDMVQVTGVNLQGSTFAVSLPPGDPI